MITRLVCEDMTSLIQAGGVKSNSPPPRIPPARRVGARLARPLVDDARRVVVRFAVVFFGVVLADVLFAAFLVFAMMLVLL